MLGVIKGLGEGQVTGVLAHDDLDQRHLVDRREEVNTNEILSVGAGLGQLGNGQCGGIGAPDATLGKARLKFFGDLVLERHVLEHCLDNQVTAVEISVLSSRLDQIQHLLRLLFGHAAALHALLQQALCVGFALLCRLLRDVLEDHFDARHGRHVGNALPHHPRAQHANLLCGLGLDIFGA